MTDDDSPEQPFFLRAEDRAEYLRELAAKLPAQPGKGTDTLCLECSSRFPGPAATGYCPRCARRIFAEDE